MPKPAAMTIAAAAALASIATAAAAAPELQGAPTAPELEMEGSEGALKGGAANDMDKDEPSFALVASLASTLSAVVEELFTSSRPPPALWPRLLLRLLPLLFLLLLLLLLGRCAGRSAF